MDNTRYNELTTEQLQKLISEYLNKDNTDYHEMKAYFFSNDALEQFDKRMKEEFDKSIKKGLMKEVYRDLHINMSTKKMADVLYAGIMTDAKFTTLWTLGGKSYSRTQNARNGASIKVLIKEELISKFEELSGCKLETPQRIGGCNAY